MVKGEEFRGGYRVKFSEEHGPLERDSAGNIKLFCSEDSWMSPVKSEQKKKFGRTFTRKERLEYEELFTIANLCQCGEPMDYFSKDLRITDKRTGNVQYFPSERFLYCEKCDITMLDCGTSNQYVKKMLDAGVSASDAIGVFDQ